MTKILFFAGSAREKSTTKRLAITASEMAAEKGIDATFIDLKDYPMPIYDGDLEDEQGVPENAKKLKKLFVEHDGLFIVTPEYNGSLTPLFKNTIDWISRPDGEDIGEPYKGKVIGLAAASPGGMGGMRVLVPLRQLMGNLGSHIIPTQASINFIFNAFDDDGNLTDDNQRGLLSATLDELKSTAEALSK
ncbi:NADPH-dependent FMN reductase [Pseudemcibacter aquimaris]|uniref:NADPH-dependent FMN reductase n=1 Tax=Pseudemcibacter aquimaris TaxID=2857064 RepID=UPI002013536B|nr:NAD(P)H-dependent oxidoreductase [Pseudemcibacter aquimaris]MCC3859803.1 NAD(P)H-dependent oxidoreductase [Pseudemcibacter aquimaris]WDU60197.1 NAD(P)H-dependent oxidoreductase [Pseudemcibacter aquimaris]